jgi:molybdenum cofactor biosynthesis enzyme MoaA
MGFGWECLRPEDEAAILNGIKDGQVYGGPYHVEIDPFDLCNVSCFFCGSAHLHQGGKLGWGALEPIVDNLIANDLRSFRMAGGGEPLIYPDLDPLCSRMASAGVTLDNLTTNGILLHKWMDTLLKCSINHVLVSLNYGSPSDYAKYMQTGPEKFDTVVRNIRLLNDRLEQAGLRERTEIHTQFFIHRSTVESIPGMVELGLSLPVNSITFRTIGEIPPEEYVGPEQIERLKELIRHMVTETAGRRWLELDFGLVGLQEYSEHLIRE